MHCSLLSSLWHASYVCALLLLLVLALVSGRTCGCMGPCCTHLLCYPLCWQRPCPSSLSSRQRCLSAVLRQGHHSAQHMSRRMLAVVCCSPEHWCVSPHFTWGTRGIHAVSACCCTSSKARWAMHRICACVCSKARVHVVGERAASRPGHAIPASRQSGDQAGLVAVAATAPSRQPSLPRPRARASAALRLATQLPALWSVPAELSLYIYVWIYHRKGRRKLHYIKHTNTRARVCT